MDGDGSMYSCKVIHVASIFFCMFLSLDVVALLNRYMKGNREFCVSSNDLHQEQLSELQMVS